MFWAWFIAGLLILALFPAAEPPVCFELHCSFVRPHNVSKIVMKIFSSPPEALLFVLLSNQPVTHCYPPSFQALPEFCCKTFTHTIAQSHLEAIHFSVLGEGNFPIMFNNYKKKTAGIKRGGKTGVFSGQSILC